MLATLNSYRKCTLSQVLGELKRTITGADEAGGKDVMANNAIPAGCGATPIQPSNTPGCMNPVRETSKRSFKVYPNPFGQEINVELDVFGKGTVEAQLYDHMGRLLQQYPLEEYFEGRQVWRISINGQELANGLYLLQVLVDGSPAMTEKIIKL